jgi:hypothetical protein
MYEIVHPTCNHSVHQLKKYSCITIIAQNRDRWWALVNAVMNLQVP